MWEKKGATVTVVTPPRVCNFNSGWLGHLFYSQNMFSPKPRNTPRPDLAKFSVPKLRPSPSLNVMPKTPRSAGPRTPYAKTPSHSSTPASLSSTSPASIPKAYTQALFLINVGMDSPYKTPLKSRDLFDETTTNHIVVRTPDPKRLSRRYVILASNYDGVWLFSQVVHWAYQWWEW